MTHLHCSFDIGQVLVPWLDTLGLSEQQRQLHWDCIDTLEMAKAYRSAYKGPKPPINVKLEYLGKYFEASEESAAHLQAHRCV
jgi:hypothetical protein